MRKWPIFIKKKLKQIKMKNICIKSRDCDYDERFNVITEIYNNLPAHNDQWSLTDSLIH